MHAIVCRQMSFFFLARWRSSPWHTSPPRASFLCRWAFCSLTSCGPICWEPSYRPVRSPWRWSLWTCCSLSPCNLVKNQGKPKKKDGPSKNMVQTNTFSLDTFFMGAFASMTWGKIALAWLLHARFVPRVWFHVSFPCFQPNPWCTGGQKAWHCFLAGYSHGGCTGFVIVFFLDVNSLSFELEGPWEPRGANQFIPGNWFPVLHVVHAQHCAAVVPRAPRFQASACISSGLVFCGSAWCNKPNNMKQQQWTNSMEPRIFIPWSKSFQAVEAHWRHMNISMGDINPKHLETLALARSTLKHWDWRVLTYGPFWKFRAQWFWWHISLGDIKNWEHVETLALTHVTNRPAAEKRVQKPATSRIRRLFWCLVYYLIVKGW